MMIIVEKLIFCDGGVECPRYAPSNNDGVKSGISSDQVRTIAAVNRWVSRGKKIIAGPARCALVSLVQTRK